MKSSNLGVWRSFLQIHAQPNGMVGKTVGFAIALAADVSDGELQGAC
jgi:hypothetical protein